MRRPGVSIGAGVIWIMAGAAASAADCRAEFDGGITISVADDRLVTSLGGQMVAEETLPLVGSGWGCEAIHAFPDHGLLFLEWHEGAAGTYSIFSQVDLLAFSVARSGASPAGHWVLRQTVNDVEGTSHKTLRDYSLTPRPDSVTVTLTGVERVVVDAR